MLQTSDGPRKDDEEDEDEREFVDEDRVKREEDLPDDTVERDDLPAVFVNTRPKQYVKKGGKSQTQPPAVTETPASSRYT